MDQILYIKLGTLFWIIQAIPDSQNTDTVTVEIRRLSDGYTWNFTTLAFASGNNSGSMTFFNGITWKQSFTPPTADTYIVTITNSTLDVKYSQTLIAQSQATPIQSISEITTVSASTLLAAVEQAIAARLNGGAVKSYTMPNGRNVQYMDLAELFELRRKLTAEVNAASYSGRTHAKFVNAD